MDNNNCMDFLDYSQEQHELLLFEYGTFPQFMFVLTFSQLKFRARAPRSMCNIVNQHRGLSHYQVLQWVKEPRCLLENRRFCICK